MKYGIPLVVLVGGVSRGKTRFFEELTNLQGPRPTMAITPPILVDCQGSFFVVDTPGFKPNRRKYEYSWQGIFRDADVILDFGEWSDDEIYGERFNNYVKYMTWSGNNQETVERIQEYLQGRR
jgi:hypothetical protein